MPLYLSLLFALFTTFHSVFMLSNSKFLSNNELSKDFKIQSLIDQIEKLSEENKHPKDIIFDTKESLNSPAWIDSYKKSTNYISVDIFCLLFHSI